MLNMVGHGDNLGIKGAFAGYRYVANGSDQIENLRDSIGVEADPSSPDWFHYARYWNGWTVLLKPLLVFLNLNQIRLLTFTVVTLLIVLLASLLARLARVGPGLVVAVAFSLAAYPTACFSLSLSMCLLVALMVSILVVMRASTCHNCGRLLLSTFDWPGFFLIVGAVTVYLDFLCTPIVTLGVPLALLVVCSSKELSEMRGLAVARALCSCCVLWVLGYAGLWVAKWVISAAFLPELDVIGNALGQAAQRSGNIVMEGTGGAVFDITSLDSIARNFSLMFPKWILVAFGVLASFAFGLAVRDKAYVRRGLAAPLSCLLFISLFPYLWYIALSNHSYVHYWFTFRAQIVTVVALGLAFCLLLWNHDTATSKRCDFDD